MKIIKYEEAVYEVSRNGQLPTVEVIFELSNGALYKGNRTIKQSARTIRRRFRLWLAGKAKDRYEFEEIESVLWHYR